VHHCPQRRPPFPADFAVYTAYCFLFLQKVCLIFSDSHVGNTFFPTAIDYCLSATQISPLNPSANHRSFAQHHCHPISTCLDMPVSVHSIRALNGFSSVSTTGSSSHSSPAQRFANLGGFMQKQSQCLNFSSRRGNLPIHGKPGESSKRAQRPTLRLPYTTRRVPPPPSPPRVSTIVYTSEDPFTNADSFDPTRTVIYESQPLRSRRGLASKGIPLYTLGTDIPRQVAMAPDKEARSKLVAGILLHRVHAVGKPIRRAPMIREGPREYVRSGLSSIITME
jgi:hypothetical protein